MSFAAPVAATALHDVFSALWLALLATIRRRWSSVVRAIKHKDGRRVMLAALLGGPVGMAGYVMAILWLALLATIRRRWSSVVRAIKHKDGRRVMLAALLGGPVGMAGYVMAIRFLGPGLAASISSFYPALGLAASALLFHEPVKRHQVAGMVLSHFLFLSCTGTGCFCSAVS